MAVGEEAEMADFDKAGRQDMQQETPDKLDRLQCHKFLLIVIGGVSPAEGHLALSHFDETSIGDSNSMRIARQVACPSRYRRAVLHVVPIMENVRREDGLSLTELSHVLQVLPRSGELKVLELAAVDGNGTLRAMAHSSPNRRASECML